jgi:hypothetical protein
MPGEYNAIRGCALDILPFVKGGVTVRLTGKTGSTWWTLATSQG